MEKNMVLYPFGHFTLQKLDVDTGLNNSYLAQKQMVHYLYYKFLDHYIYKKDFSNLFKYLKMDSDSNIIIVKDINDYKNNDIKENTEEELEKKLNFIEKNVLPISAARDLLKKLVVELDYKWYNLPEKISVVNEVFYRFIKKYFKSQIVE